MKKIIKLNLNFKEIITQNATIEKRSKMSQAYLLNNEK
jgi:hypothetical protein